MFETILKLNILLFESTFLNWRIVLPLPSFIGKGTVDKHYFIIPSIIAFMYI